MDAKQGAALGKGVDIEEAKEQLAVLQARIANERHRYREMRMEMDRRHEESLMGLEYEAKVYADYISRVVGDKIMPTEAFAKAQYQLGKEAEKAMNHAFRLGPDPAFERAEERIRGRADTMAFFLGLVCGIFLFTVGVLIAGWWK